MGGSLWVFHGRAFVVSDPGELSSIINLRDPDFDGPVSVDGIARGRVGSAIDRNIDPSEMLRHFLSVA